ncbi:MULTISPECIES: efflux RND transporter periplasmic adaptor subunit [Flavobacteriaceae]|uniref:efflux RND transporter periplasmic adaptor subunit n=1 Tax=Flavobacteriaceae TaxID=49546 RepID=UPI001199D373|nr:MULTISPECIES: efflux RND transporter periplasmic adaptor subunit [Flavobacteriaceae]MCD9620429.1 efflux RND transporter periplasmic adaptor subunit [Tenacibaculum maritimum]MCD9626648.1 efflux RND transporter periplasmic adaptor subunit [Tenacibaculum maritimum]MCD9629045.1 efflux RND transporter periplasmic adaptor subunit [Tenacibaculum maritimum]MCD9632458.1 efflux RND transporter periplasmic adaptor subunit [Tenacibaculum maritimum]TVZ51181.1 Cu(I)/Ag(I) efflux system membrane fusion pr
MNKNILYIGIAVIVGLLAGWLIFGNSGSEANANKDVSEMSDTHDHSGESPNQMWTCSMHPQIMQPEPGDCPICGMDLIPAESGADGLAVNEIKMTENAMALANIQTTIVGNGTMSEDDGMISLSGKIATNEENNAVQASYFDGRIERLNVNYEGQKVNRGQLLATIYAPNLVAAQQELLTTASLKESQPELYKAVRNKLKLWKLSEAQINAIETSGKVRDNFPVYASVSGTVSEVMAREGDYVKQGQPILKVSNLNSVWAEFDAYENQISDLKVGQKIKVVTNAYANKEFDATVSFIDPILNNATRTVTVRATLKNTDDLFKPGMFVTGKLKGEMMMTNEVITVPASAVMWTGERSLVYIKTNPNEPVFEMREVTIGNRNGENYAVTEGLQNGDEIVTNGTFTVDAAAQLQGKNSMMNQGKKEDAMMPMSEMEMEFSENFQRQFKQALKPYLQMKDALVASDANQVSAFAKATSVSLKSADIKSLGSMEQSHIKKSVEMLDAISANDNLENQRDHFVILNENMVPIAMNINGTDAMLYVQKCPMANNNKGAVWLSAEKDIRNPYYGDAMLTCGSVIEEIK